MVTKLRLPLLQLTGVQDVGTYNKAISARIVLNTVVREILQDDALKNHTKSCDVALATDIEQL